MKTPWAVERLVKASDKVVEKLREKYVNPPPVKVNKQDALEMGKPVCPVVIEMYSEGLKTLVEQMPYVSSRYTINTEKLKASIASDKYFCNRKIFIVAWITYIYVWQRFERYFSHHRAKWTDLFPLYIVLTRKLA